MTKYEKIENYILEEIEQLSFQKKQLEQKLNLNEIELNSLNDNRLSLNYDSFDTGDIFQVDNFMKEAFTSDIDIKLKEKIEYINIDNSETKENIELINNKINRLSNLLTDDDSLASNENNNDLINIYNLECLRLSRDLHDSSIQNITAVIRKQELLKVSLLKDINRGMIEIDNCISLLKSVNEELRNDVYCLRNFSTDRNVNIDENGIYINPELLIYKIKEVVNKYDNLGFEIEYNIDNNILEENYFISSSISKKNCFLTIISILNELISNSVKYSDGNKILFELKLDKKSLIINYSDNGKGFDYYSFVTQDSIVTDLNHNSSKFGLKIIQERINILKGIINFVNDINDDFTYKFIINIPIS